MIKNIVAKLKGIYIGWDYDKYWDCREALFDPKTCRLKFLYCKHYVSITNRRQNADIAYCIEAGNNFKGRPILGHNLNGIVIAAGAIIGKNCFLSHQVTIGRNRGGHRPLEIMFTEDLEQKFLAQFILEIMLELGQIVLCLKMCQINATVVLPKPRIIIKSPDYQYYVANPNDWTAQGE